MKSKKKLILVIVVIVILIILIAGSVFAFFATQSRNLDVVNSSAYVIDDVKLIYTTDDGNTEEIQVDDELEIDETVSLTISDYVDQEGTLELVGSVGDLEQTIASVGTVSPDDKEPIVIDIR